MIQRRRRRRGLMTVCIAAMCKWEDQVVIVGASDRMITYGDIEYEPARTKIYPLTSHVVALTAGTTAENAAIYRQVAARVLPLGDPGVPVVAEIYGQEFANFRRMKNERNLLTPLGLTTYSL